MMTRPFVIGGAVFAAPITWAVLALVSGYCLPFFDNPVVPDTGSCVALGSAIEISFSWILWFATVSLLYPVVEELAFRGLVQGELLQRFPPMESSWLGISQANLLTSILFVACHTIYHPPLWSLSIIFPSLIFGYFRDESGHIGISIMLHVLYNAGFYLLFHAGAALLD